MTAEDVFALYETKVNDISVSVTPLIPKSIGNIDVPCSIKRRCYIKPGEECPICIESILTKTNAFLTCCGHAFHKSCIFKCVEKKWEEKYPGTFYCPVCRTYLGCDVHDMNERYVIPSINDDFEGENSFKGENSFEGVKKLNYLDILENFWLTKDLSLALPCRNRYDHYVGMKKDCYRCKQFVLYGEYD